MKAVIFREHGGTHKLSYEDFPKPTIGPGDVLIRAKACAQPSGYLGP
jgi:NADPH:quinone reductase-like Zn-dependent oxidoreductase